MRKTILAILIIALSITTFACDQSESMSGRYMMYQVEGVIDGEPDEIDDNGTPFMSVDIPFHPNNAIPFYKDSPDWRYEDDGTITLCVPKYVTGGWDMTISIKQEDSSFEADYFIDHNVKGTYELSEDNALTFYADGQVYSGMFDSNNHIVIYYDDKVFYYKRG